MARRRRVEKNEINAGSMADIAFLLLIFFLVTTTMDIDSGIVRKLPEKPPKNYTPPVLKHKNVFEVIINKNDALLVEDALMDLKDLKFAAVRFIDNRGKDPASSDHPSKAIISVQSDQGTSYGAYIAVQNELLAAYRELRDQYAADSLTGPYRGYTYKELTALYKNDRSNEVLQAAIEKIKTTYPQLLSDAASSQ